MQTYSPGYLTRDSIFFRPHRIEIGEDVGEDDYVEHVVPWTILKVVESALITPEERASIHVQRACNFKYYGPSSVFKEVLRYLIAHCMQCKGTNTELSIWGEDRRLHLRYEIDLNLYKDSNGQLPEAIIERRQTDLKLCHAMLSRVGGRAECYEDDFSLEFILHLPIKSIN